MFISKEHRNITKELKFLKEKLDFKSGVFLGFLK